MIAAVVTAYHPDEDLLVGLAALRNQVDRVVIVNDAPGSSADDPILKRLAGEDLEIIDHGRNRGIAAALNTGIARLRTGNNELTAVLTCDQDSVLPAGYLENLQATWRRGLAAGVPVGLISPSSAGNIGRLPGARAGEAVVIGGEPIQSGMLIPAATLATVGQFDESLFIDGVDSDYYLRCLDAGLAAIVARVAIEHQLGRTVSVRLGPWRPQLTVAGDHRYYYRVRNLIVLARRHARRHPGWVLRALTKELRHQLITMALVPGRSKRGRMSVRGLRDGIANRTGRLEDYHDYRA